MFKYKVDKVLSIHSFLSHQISVVAISDKEENMYKGIAVFPVPEELFAEAAYHDGMGDSGKPLIIDSQIALSLCEFIEDTLTGKLPSKIIVNSNGPQLSITLKKYTKKWHDGGGYKGRVVFGYSFLTFSFSSSIISKKSLAQFKNSLISLFEFEISG